MNQTTIFDMMYPRYKITKPLRVITLFSGYDSQCLALNYLGIKYEHWRTCEWAIKSIQALKDIHFPDDNFDYSKSLTKDELINKLYNLGISSNYNEPMTFSQINKLKEKEIRKIYNNIIASKNMVNIQQVKGNDLEIVDTDKYEYIMTYSFPCFTKDSMILTEKGYIPFEQVEVGMKVLTKGNTWEKVVKKFDNGIHQTYYLNAMGFENIHCTDNHKFWVREMYRKGHIPKRYFKEPQFKEVKDITSNDYFGIPVIEVQEEFYTNNLDFWFMLGMYIGDGWLSKKSYDIIISCNDKKLDLLKEKLDINKWHYTINKSGNNCYRFRFSNKEIYNFIKENIGTGCEEKHIPIEIIKLPTKQLEEFYLGYLKSDGCIIDNKHQFSSINRNLIYSISLIINKLYHRPTCIYKIKTSKTKIIEGRTINQKDWYQLRFKITTDKQDKAFYDNGYIWYPFKSLVKANLENVYNMEVENDHSYIVDGCISKNCQDLSLAGKGKGMSDTSTRSGMLWEVERILTECKELGNMPQILLMENVPQVHSQDNMPDFHKWQVRLEELGYKSYWQDLIATDYEIPQTRNRCFMISILGDYSYSFPQPMKLEKKLKDMLEDNVDEKYYLSDKMLDYCMGINQKESKFPRGERFLQSLKNTNEKGIANTINTNAGNRPVDNFITEKEYIGTYDYAQSNTLRPTNESRTHIDSEVSGALLASGNHMGGENNGVVVADTLKRDLCNKLIQDGLVEEGDVVKHSYTQQIMDGNKKCVEKNDGNMITLTTRGDCVGVCVNDKPKVLGGVGERDSNNNTQWKQQNRIYDNNVAISVTTAFNPYYKSDLRIRKLTPRECFRLMGVKDEDFEKVRKNQSDSSLYHLAGDSIVVNVLMAIFKELF